ncbi:venom serine protease inhibitor [Drosophila rhopaloa]|uniref:Allergen Api m 6 n=1 Tax=Drosophila rhopaloa TaxID=1041015 RepID=A0A6P4FKW0_DRORH|nr:venom serine protease inhibitor [Drosophila rhopaloa]
MYIRLFSLVILWLLNYTYAELLILETCAHRDVMVKCVPVCPKLCSNYLQIRKCSPKKCKRGCACKKGWLRDKNDHGLCIPRNDCKRYIIE